MHPESRYRHDHVYFATVCVTLIRVYGSGTNTIASWTSALSEDPLTSLCFLGATNMTEVEHNSFGDPTLLLEEPGDLQDPVAQNASKTAHLRDGGGGFTLNGLLGDTLILDEDLYIGDVAGENMGSVRGGFGGEWLTPSFVGWRCFMVTFYSL